MSGEMMKTLLDKLGKIFGKPRDIEPDSLSRILVPREEPVPAPIANITLADMAKVAGAMLEGHPEITNIVVSSRGIEDSQLVPRERLTLEDAEHVVALLRPEDTTEDVLIPCSDEILKLSGELGGEITSRDQSTSIVDARRRIASRPEILMSGYHGGPVEPLPLPSPASVLRLFLRGLPAVLRDLLEDAQYHAAYEERERRRRRRRERGEGE